MCHTVDLFVAQCAPATLQNQPMGTSGAPAPPAQARFARPHATKATALAPGAHPHPPARQTAHTALQLAHVNSLVSLTGESQLQARVVSLLSYNFWKSVPHFKIHTGKVITTLNATSPQACICAHACVLLQRDIVEA